MKLDEALETIRAAKRYRSRKLKGPHRLGEYIAQSRIPIATNKQIAAAVRINKGLGHTKTMSVDVAAIRSEQMSLRFDRALWHLRRYGEMQRRVCTHPHVIMVRGRPIVWDGNHRVTAAVLLGKRRIKCKCFF